MISYSERMLEIKVKQLEDSLNDERIQNYEMANYITKLEESLSMSRQDIIILTNQLNHLLQSKNYKRKHNSRLKLA